MSGLNKVMIIGRLTRDPELKQASIKVCELSVATSKKNKQNQEVTEFHNLVAFNKTAELICQHLKKGSQAYFEGELKTESWDDKTTGQKRYKTNIVVNQMQFLDSKTTQVQPNATAQYQNYQQQQPQYQQAPQPPQVGNPMQQPQQTDQNLPF